MPSYYVQWGLGAWTPYVTYVNPYYVPSSTTIYNYSQPIAIQNFTEAATQSTVQAPAEQDAEKAARALFDEGMEAFHDNQFVVAMNKFDTAVKRLSGDPALHEIRALTYFALGKYQESAAVLNSLLAVTPGMDWTTMSGLYGDVEVYTQQLRKLESYVESNPKDASAAFVLAYHYLVTGFQEGATDLLAEVVKLQPKDMTANQMLRSLTEEDPENLSESDETTANVSITPSNASRAPVDLVGKWTAQTSEVTIYLEVTQSSTFKWRAVPKPIDGKPAGEPMELSGEVLTSRDTLVLDGDVLGVMSGKIEVLDPTQFRFIVPGSPPNDPGLVFKK